MRNKTQTIKSVLLELKHHIPFTALATLGAILIVVFIQYYLKKGISEDSFHILHFLHVIASAMVTAGIYYKYKPKIVYAFLVGITGAIVIGSISDIIFPYFGAIILGAEVDFHLPLIEETFFTLLSAVFGSMAGIATRITKIPHFIHVFLSVFASLFYLLVFSAGFAFGHFVWAFLIVFVSVIIPCCISDIFFPFIFLKEKSGKCLKCNER